MAPKQLEDLGAALPTDNLGRDEGAEPNGTEPSEVEERSPRLPTCQPADLYEDVTAALQKVARHRERPLFVLHGRIDEDVSETVYSWRKELRNAGKDDNLDILIDSPGGELTPCYRTARLFSRYTNDWEALVPDLAASGATLICLGSSKILLSDIAQLGPMDPQVISKRPGKFFFAERQSPLEAFQAVTYLRAFSLKVLDAGMTFLAELGVAPQTALDTATRLAIETVRPVMEKIEPYDLGAFALDSSLATEYCKRVSQPAEGLKRTQRGAKYDALVETYPAHSFVIDKSEAELLGLVVEEPCEELNDIFDEVRPLLRKLRSYIGLVPEPKKGAQ